MRFEATVGEHGEIVVPADVRSELRLTPHTRVAIDIRDVLPEVSSGEPDEKKLNELIARLGGPMRADLLADGYASFDEYIDDIEEADVARSALASVFEDGAVVLSAVVYAELAGRFAARADLNAFFRCGIAELTQLKCGQRISLERTSRDTE